MKQHMMIYEKAKKVVLKQYLSECLHCRKFDFVNCHEEEKEGGSDVTVGVEYLADKNFEVSKEEKVFDFVEVPWFVTFITGVTDEPLYLLKLTEKGISDGNLIDTWGQVIFPGVHYFKWNYLKPVCSRNIYLKKTEILPLSVVITPDEVYDSYVETNEDTLLDIIVYNSLIQKAKC